MWYLDYCIHCPQAFGQDYLVLVVGNFSHMDTRDRGTNHIGNNTWDVGVFVEIQHREGVDHVSVYRTKGSNGYCWSASNLIAEFENEISEGDNDE